MSRAAASKSNTKDPTFWAKWEPLRYRIRPPECDMGDGHTCWVRRPYEAITPNHLTPRCTGCGGRIGQSNRGNTWLKVNSAAS